jgi:hypothetical protein
VRKHQGRNKPVLKLYTASAGKLLHRRPTEREKQDRKENTTLARRITFGTATTIVTLVKEGDGRDLSLSETVSYAPRSESKINFSVKKNKVNTK